MECQSCTEDLSAFLDGELAQADHDRIQSHMADCRDCRSEFESMHFAYGLTERLPSLDLNPDLWNRVQAEIKPVSVQTERRGFDWRSLFFRPWIPVTATALAAFLAVFLVLPTTSPEKDFQVEQMLTEYVEERDEISARNVQLFSESDNSLPSVQTGAGTGFNPFIQPVSQVSGNPYLQESLRK